MADCGCIAGASKAGAAESTAESAECKCIIGALGGSYVSCGSFAGSTAAGIAGAETEGRDAEDQQAGAGGPMT